MSSVLISIISLIVTLGILIAFHEFGHFWVARRLGVKVLRFSIGFGKPLWKTTKGADNTEYVLAAIPLGGYVKMLDEREGEVDEKELHRAFNRQKVGTRIAIVVAGPVFNFIFAILAYFIMYSIGVPGIKPFIGEVSPNSIADKAGIVTGLQIKKVGGTETPTWSTTRLTLLEKSLDSDIVILELQDETQDIRDYSIDLSSLSTEMKQKDLLQFIGIRPYIEPLPAVIGDLEKDGAAYRDGLRSGDRIISANGVEIVDWMQWVKIVQDHPGKVINVEMQRGQVTEFINLTPKRVEANDKTKGYIGAAPELPKNRNEKLRTVVQYGPVTALTTAVEKTWQMSALTLRMIGKMIVGEVSLKNLSGPITIATYAGYTASIGLAAFLSFLAIVSISLGVLNLLPIPLLDGGHLLNYLIELVKGSELSESIQLRMQHIGIMLLAVLMSLAFYNDIRRLFGE